MRRVNRACSTVEGFGVWLNALMPADSFIAFAGTIARVTYNHFCYYYLCQQGRGYMVVLSVCLCIIP